MERIDKKRPVKQTIEGRDTIENSYSNKHKMDKQQQQTNNGSFNSTQRVNKSLKHADVKWN